MTDQPIQFDTRSYFRSTETDCPVSNYSLVTNSSAQQTAVSGLDLSNFILDGTSLKIMPKLAGNYSIALKAETSSGVAAYKTIILNVTQEKPAYILTIPTVVPVLEVTEPAVVPVLEDATPPKKNETANATLPPSSTSNATLPINSTVVPIKPKPPAISTTTPPVVVKPQLPAIDKTLPPPQLKISPISPTGEFSLNFDQDMILP